MAMIKKLTHVWKTSSAATKLFGFGTVAAVSGLISEGFLPERNLVSTSLLVGGGLFMAWMTASSYSADCEPEIDDETRKEIKNAYQQALSRIRAKEKFYSTDKPKDPSQFH